MFFSNVNSFLYLTLAVLHCQLISKISRIFVAYQVQYLNPLSVRIRAKISPSGILLTSLFLGQQTVISCFSVRDQIGLP